MAVGTTDPRMSPAMKKAIVAKLLDHFGVSLDAYARLTDKQILGLYFHKRTAEGEIEAEEQKTEVQEQDRPPSLESELQSLALLAVKLRLPKEEMERAREQLRAKYAAMNLAQETPSPEASTNG